MSYVFLLLALLAYSLAGWVLVGDTIPIYVLALSAGGLFLCLQRPLRLPIACRGPVLAVFLLSLWSFLGLFAAEDKLKAVAGSLGWLAGFGLCLYVCVVVQRWERFLWLLILFCMIHCAGLFAGLYQRVFHEGYFSPATFVGGAAGFEGMNYAFGKNYLPILAFGMAGIILNRYRLSVVKQRWLWAMIVLALLGIAISQSRSTQLGAVCGVLLALFYARRRLLSVILVGGVVCGLSGAVFLANHEEWYVLFERDPTLGDIGPMSRYAVWRAAFRALPDHWIVGVGGWNFPLHVADYMDLADWGMFLPQVVSNEGGLAIHPHNVFISLAVECGVPSLILMLWFLIQTWVLANKVYRSRETCSQCKFVALGTLLFQSMFFVDMNFHNYHSDNNLWIFSSCFLASLQWRNLPRSITKAPQVFRTRSRFAALEPNS